MKYFCANQLAGYNLRECLYGGECLQLDEEGNVRETPEACVYYVEMAQLIEEEDGM